MKVDRIVGPTRVLPFIAWLFFFLLFSSLAQQQNVITIHNRSTHGRLFALEHSQACTHTHWESSDRHMNCDRNAIHLHTMWPDFCCCCHSRSLYCEHTPCCWACSSCDAFFSYAPSSHFNTLDTSSIHFKRSRGNKKVVFVSRSFECGNRIRIIANPVASS